MGTKIIFLSCRLSFSVTNFAKNERKISSYSLIIHCLSMFFSFICIIEESLALYASH